MEQVIRGCVVEHEEYQKGQSDGFHPYHHQGQSTIDDFYADSLLFTYGNPCQHIWTYVVGRYDNHIES